MPVTTQLLRAARVAFSSKLIPTPTVYQIRRASTANSRSIRVGGRDISVPTGIYINNEFRKSIGGTTFGVENPATGREILQVEEGRETDVDEAVKAARLAFRSGEWSNADPVYRGDLLRRLADLMERDKDDIIALEMLDTGKTHRQASTLDFPSSVSTLKYYAGYADKVHGLTSFNIPKTFAYTRREPIGVCGQIIPWNFPLLMFTWKIAPALVTGNTVVIKSAEATPLSALKMTELIQEAGFPAGVINHVPGFGKTVGNAIANHMNVDKVAFTGSTATGRSILKSAASSNLKKVTLELGGKSPNIVFPDADLEKAADWSAWGINMNFGQTCHAGTRIYVHEDVYDSFVEKFASRLSKLKVGDNFDPTTDQGPQNSKMQYDKILGYIESGRKEGATVHLGGKPATSGTEGGYYIQPTIFTNVKPDMQVSALDMDDVRTVLISDEQIMREEIFGPVVAISKFSTEEEVLELANDSSYGLAAAVHTSDYARAIRMTNALQAGTTWVNMFNFVHYSIPFGGFKESGIGRECGEAVLENYTETKAVYLNMGLQAPQ
ncbi:Aldehyde dehydrogenase [Colletotrichum karsti]|uniref:aldehyde dehydrogenase (NAD(+)) n=1 Tax=Colletotrichum karsti TaxID=1095194 RepID=A0A9P6HYI8_9PEZI|nr:Aldehyde dehydrogenase [Colletotrichum karsti]KAF9873938.1 Aldehyde dehydrogenase [Colletotrichum karsti]